MDYFTTKETSCRCGCGFDIRPEMLAVLNEIREKVGPLSLSSGARCEAHNKVIRGADHSAHVLGLAADIKCADPHLRYRIVKAALEVGIRRIEWATPSWVHIDIAVTPLHPQDVMFRP